MKNMKTKVRDTSIEAYNDIKPELNKRQAEVLGVIRRYGKISNRGIARILSLEINQVTGRVNELVKKGSVTTHEKGIDPQTKKTVHLWEINK